MKTEGNEIFEGIKERILARIQEENWYPFHFTKHKFCCDDIDKELAFFFENDSFGFHFNLFADEIGEEWLEHMMIGIDVYDYEKERMRYVGYGRMVDEPDILKKIYGIVKEEMEYVYNQNKHIRLKCLLKGKEMLEMTGQLAQVLKKIMRAEGEKYGKVRKRNIKKYVRKNTHKSS